MPYSIPVVVRVPSRLTLDQSTKILANTLNKLGCVACLSGFDIRFTNIRDLVINPRTLNVSDIGGGLQG